MRTKQTFMYGARNLICAIAVVLALTITACDDGSDGGKTDPTDPTVTWPADLTALHGQTLSAIPLASYVNDGGTTGAFSWTTPGDSVGDLGRRSHNMTFTPADTESYNTVTKDVDLAVRLMEMVKVTAGTFKMGSPDPEINRGGSGGTQWDVTLTQDFYLGKYEITQKQWHTVMGTTIQELNTAADPTIDADYGRGDNYPVYWVSWYDALVFCNKLSVKEGLTPAYRIDGKTDPAEWGTVPTSSDATRDAAEIVAGSTGYRLPTEAQWEYAAKGGQNASDPYKIYSGSDTIGDVAWYDENSGDNGENGKSHEVGTKDPNELGLYDMAGNIFEWCWDWWGEFPASEGTDPLGASEHYGRVMRGGSFGNGELEARAVVYCSPFYRVFTQGFRALRPAP